MAELNYRYDNDIDLDRDSLYKYVIELGELEKTINEVGPENPDTFGSLETFKGSNKKYSNSTLFFCIVIVLVVIALAIFSSCKTNDNTPTYSSDMYIPANYGYNSHYQLFQPTHC